MTATTLLAAALIAAYWQLRQLFGLPRGEATIGFTTSLVIYLFVSAIPNP